MDAAAKREWAIERARALGFDLCGVAPAETFPELAHLTEWLSRGYAGEMRYLQDPRRNSPELVMPGARSVIVCAMNYNTAQPYSTEFAGAAGSAPTKRGWISRYAWGDDYHEVLVEKLETLVAAMRAEFDEPFEARAYVDTGPIVERVAAKYAGLGWLGKNTCLIHERMGSWLFLGTIVTTLELTDSDSNVDKRRDAEARRKTELQPDLCGNCTMCIEACPTGAIVEPYVLDARRCISYLTIELRGSIPEEFQGALAGNVFGCDICQDVCPYNRRAAVTQEPRFQPRQIAGENGGEFADSLFAPRLEWLASLNEDDFRRVFAHSAIKRTKHAGLRRNAAAVWR